MQITAEHDTDGKTKPLALVWTNGVRYEIDRVMDVRRAPALKAGGLGTRYTVRIRGDGFWKSSRKLLDFVEFP
jgi:hypothetical protein